MRVVHSLAAATSAAGVNADVTGAVVSIGNFDGVHLGHRALLARMRDLAHERGVPSVVVTFFPPAKVYFTGANYLSTAYEKRLLLSEYSPDLLVVIGFDEEFSRTTSTQFVRDVAALTPSAFVVGGDFRFGLRRQGSVDDLAMVAPVEPFALVNVHGSPVGSSRIRELLAAGRIEECNHLLGAPYMAHGTVVLGQRRGHTIGFPTANLILPPRKALPPGVFAVSVSTPSGSFGGMANVGPRPTFQEEPPSLEVNLFDFSGNLYNQEITVRFSRRLRNQQRFGSIDELKAQLVADERAARQVLAQV